MILKEIDLTIFSIFFWTDSKVIVQYINNESRRFKTYVANRVSEIREVSKPSQWRHCLGTLNPADDASRGLSVNQLLHNERWFKGPAFLSKPEEDWPHVEIAALPEEDPEVKNKKAIFTLMVPDKLHELLEKYSSWTVLQRKIAWLLRFKVYLQHCKQKGTVSDTSHKYLTIAYLEKANIAIVKLVQGEVYAEEIKDFENQGTSNAPARLPSPDQC